MRGSGRFRRVVRQRARRAACVSIPFIAGQWSLRSRTHPSRQSGCPVSIPFIAGQWSLPMEILTGLIAMITSQSPSLRGSGRFENQIETLVRLRTRLNPLHCGAVVASVAASVSPRFIAESQSPSLRGSGRFGAQRERRTYDSPGLNPLHCGAVVASWMLRDTRAGSWSSLNPLHCGAVIASRPTGQR